MQIPQPELTGMSAERLARIRPVLERYVTRGQVPGFIWRVYRHGQLACADSVGYCDMALKRPISEENIFRIYSMTKPVTAVGLMMLFEEGAFQLADPVSQYIDGFDDLLVGIADSQGNLVERPLSRPITVHDLFTHRAGLSYGFWEDHPVEDLYRASHLLEEPTLGGLVAKALKLPLVHQPGQVYRYSIALDVLGRIIEVISGQSYDDYMADRLFGPLGMVDTHVWTADEQDPRLATMYAVTPRGQTQKVTAPLLGIGGAGLVSTLEDYSRFARMLLNGGRFGGGRQDGARHPGARIISRPTLELMTRNHLTPDQLPFIVGEAEHSGEGYGLGFGRLVDAAQAGTLASEETFFWGGAAATMFWVDPARDLTAVMMTQLMANPYPFQSQFRTLVYQAIED